MTIDEHGRPEPPEQGSETDTLVGFLDFHRATLALKTDGLDDAALHTAATVSSMTLAGLLKHVAYVEHWWLRECFLGRDAVAPWDTGELAADPDWDWHSAADESGAQLRLLWRDSVEASRAALAEALDAGGLDQLAARRRRDGSTVSLRWVLVHLVEEYARHNGHADLLREALDGSTGE